MSKKFKILCCILVICSICLILLYFFSSIGGNTRNVNRKSTKSQIFSQQDIDSAMDIVEMKFQNDYDGCTLTDLWYDEEISELCADEWAAQYHADEAIVLLSNYKTGASSEDAGLNSNSTYPNWQWILVRNSSDNNWTLSTWGY